MKVAMKYRIENLDCANCAAKLEDGLKQLDSVSFVSINFASGLMHIETSDMDRVRREIVNLEPGVRLRDYETRPVSPKESFNPRPELIWIIIAVTLFLVGMIFQGIIESTTGHLGEYLLFGVIYLFAGWKVLRNAARNIIKGRLFDENFLMTVATLGAFAIHAPSEAAGVMLFFKVGEFLQGLALHRSRRSIRALLEIRPDYANVLRDGQTARVSPEAVNVGDSIIVRPGEKIPLDGIIITGSTSVDTSPLTGESRPLTARPNDLVLAGTINQSGMITVRVTRPFGESSVSKILSLVENATNKKAQTEKFFTTFAKYYTPAVVAMASMVAIIPPLVFSGSTFSDWIYRALVVLVISCPCALVVSIPLAYFGGIGRASRAGILIKGSNYLDALRSVETVVFDKTGMLTQGVFKVTGIIPVNGFAEKQILSWAARAEAHSNHPIAISIREAAGTNGAKLENHDFEEIGGQGVRAVIDGKTVLVGNDHLLHKHAIAHDVCAIPGTVVHVAVDSTYAGYIVISDELKPDTEWAIKNLRHLKIKKIVMLTGDSSSAAKPVAEKLGLDGYFAGLMPEEKVAALERILSGQEKGKVAFVGDGINDAPVLARSDVGISMGSLGSDAAIETADIVIMNDSLAKLPEAVTIAQKTHRILIQNIVLALGIKGAFIVLGLAGVATMWEAVFGDMGVALLAILNAARLIGIRRI